MCSPPHSQVMEIRAKRYKTKGISANHKHSISAGVPSGKRFLKHYWQRTRFCCFWPTLELVLQLCGGPRAFRIPSWDQKTSRRTLSGDREVWGAEGAQLSKPSGRKSTHGIRKYAELIWRRMEELLARSGSFERKLISKNWEEREKKKSIMDT